MRNWLFATALVCLVTGRCHRAPPATKTGRVVSISPSTTEAVYAVGAGPQMVGRSRYCDWPPEVMKLPEVGGFVDPSFEAILALRPDLVVGARGPAGSAIADRLLARGIATWFPETESFSAIDAMILGVGERTGHADAARTAVAALDARIAKIETAVASLPKTRVLLVFGLAPLSVAGPSSFADELVRRGGGTNVVTEGGAYPTLGVERVLALDPDVIINAAMMEEGSAARLSKTAPGWNRVRAVQSDRVVTLKDEVVLRPGPRIGEGLDKIAKAIHPEAPL